MGDAIDKREEQIAQMIKDMKIQDDAIKLHESADLQI
jgi:hypothetical protein